MGRGTKIVERYKLELDGVEYVIPIKMKKFKADYGVDNDPRDGKSVFYVHMGDYDIDVKPSMDIDAVRNRAIKQLKEANKVTWEKFIRIKYSGPDEIYHPTNKEERDVLNYDVDFGFDTDVIEIGTRPNGKKLWRDYPRSYHNKGANEGEPETGHKVSQRYSHRDFSVSLLPYTPENVKAIMKMAKAFDSFNQHLHKGFSKQIKKMLKDPSAFIRGK